MNVALRTCNKLNTFWYSTFCSYKWKLHVYNAVIIAQISYGMNTVHLTQAMLNKLEGDLEIFYKLNIQTTQGYRTRKSYNNIDMVLNKGTDLNISRQEFIAAGKFDKPKTIATLSESITNHQNRTFAHGVKAKDQDPMKQMTVTSSLDIPGVHLRRVGRPRTPWIQANCKWLYEKDMWGLCTTMITKYTKTGLKQNVLPAGRILTIGGQLETL